jgi:hypothetical protein
MHPAMARQITAQQIGNLHVEAAAQRRAREAARSRRPWRPWLPWRAPQPAPAHSPQPTG